MKLEDLKKLCDKAAPGPWTNRMQDGICNKYIDEGIVISKEERDNMRPGDAAFIAAARTYLPRLIAVAEAAQRVAMGRWIPECQSTLMLVVDGPERNQFYEALAALESD